MSISDLEVVVVESSPVVVVEETESTVEVSVKQANYVIPRHGLVAVDEFDRADGPVRDLTSSPANAWLDFATTLPHSYDPAEIHSEKVGPDYRVVTDAVTNSGDATLTSATAVFVAGDVGDTIMGAGIPSGTTIASRTSATEIEMSAAATATATGVDITIGSLGMMACYQPLGVTDGIELTVHVDVNTATWDNGIVSDLLIGGSKQVGPIAFCDPTAPTGEMGIAFFYDVSLGSCYMLAGLSPDEGSLFSDYAIDNTLYHGYDLNYQYPGFQMVESGTETPVAVTLRCVGGKIEGLINGVRVCGPIDIPAWAVGRDAWGLWVLDIFPGLPSLGVNGAGYGDIQRWEASHVTEPIGDHPATPTIRSTGAAATTTAGTSIAVPYPATIEPNDWLIAFVGRDNTGNFSDAAGWDENQFGPGGASGMCVFTKLADGTETGTQAFTRSATGDLVGVMVAVAGGNPLEYQTVDPAQIRRGVAVSGEGEALSTNIDSPAVSVSGHNRLAFWAAFIGPNEAITLPPVTVDYPNGVTSLVTSQTAAGSLKVGYLELDEVTNTTLPDLVGTLAIARTNTCVLVQVLPDPRDLDAVEARMDALELWSTTITDGDPGADGSFATAIVIASDADVGTLTDQITTANAGRWCRLTGGSAITVSVPTNATDPIPIGTVFFFTQAGAGQVTVTAATPGTTTVNGTPSVKTRAQHSLIQVTKLAADEWHVAGDVAAA